MFNLITILNRDARNKYYNNCYNFSNLYFFTDLFYLKIKLCSNFFYKHQFLILPITDNSIIFTDELSKSIFYNNYLYRIYNNNNTNL